MAVNIRLDSSKELLKIFGDGGKRFQKTLEKNLDIFLAKYKYRIFYLGLNSGANKMPPAKLPRPKRARDPKSKAKKPKYLPVPTFARNKVPPYLFRTGTLFDSIDIKVSRGAVVIRIDYPTKLLGYLEQRYGQIFQPTPEENLFWSNLFAELAQKQLEKLVRTGKVSSLI
jgi:hypothetical protein